MISIQFIVTSLVVAIIPGTGVAYTVGTGLSQKTRASFFAALGCTLGIVPHLVACFLGLSAIMHLGAQVFTVIKYSGCAYLLYLAVRTWKAAGATRFERTGNRLAPLGIIGKGILLNLLNPKLTLFFLSFLPQFLPSGQHEAARSMLALSAVFMLVTLLVFMAYGALASAISGLVRRGTSLMRNIERGFALVFAALAIRLAVPEK